MPIIYKLSVFVKMTGEIVVVRLISKKNKFDKDLRRSIMSICT